MGPVQAVPKRGEAGDRGRGIEYSLRRGHGQSSDGKGMGKGKGGREKAMMEGR